MTWLEFKRKVRDVALRLSSEEVPITFIHGDMEIRPDDIAVCCEVMGDSLALTIILKEGETK